MKEIGRHDTSVPGGMFVEAPKKLRVGVLMMWRHIAENSHRLGRSPEGRPAGEVAMTMVIQTNQPIEKIMDRKIRQHIAANGDY